MTTDVGAENNLCILHIYYMILPTQRATELRYSLFLYLHDGDSKKFLKDLLED